MFVLTLKNDRMKKEAEYDRIILGKDGLMFDGSRAMFADCFFDNANTKNIIEFAKENNVSLTINGVVIISEPNNKKPNPILMNVYGDTLRKIIGDLVKQIDDYQNYDGDLDEDDLANLDKLFEIVVEPIEIYNEHNHGNIPLPKRK